MERNARTEKVRVVGGGDVAKVIYQGLETPQHDLARRQMRGFTGMVTAILDRDLEGTRRVLERCRVFTLAESLGGVESLIEHPAIMTHASIPLAQRAELGISDGLIRLSVGVEDAEDLIADLGGRSSRTTNPYSVTSGLPLGPGAPGPRGTRGPSSAPLDARRPWRRARPFRVPPGCVLGCFAALRPSMPGVWAQRVVAPRFFGAYASGRWAFPVAPFAFGGAGGTPSRALPPTTR